LLLLASLLMASFLFERSGDSEITSSFAEPRAGLAFLHRHIVIVM
jgi:hypothetical protein